MRSCAAALALLTGAGCTSGTQSLKPTDGGPPPASLVVRGPAALDEQTCQPNVAAGPASGELVLDTAAAFALRVTLLVDNPTELAVAPLRLSVRWQCEPTDLGPLAPVVLPAYALRNPFCKGTGAEFVGFDFVPAAGPTILPRSTGVVRVELVPYQLGQEIDRLFAIARLADECCRAPGTNCDGFATTAGCRDLEAIFAQLDPSGTLLSVRSERAGSPSRALLQYRPFSVFDGVYSDSLSTMPLPERGPRYPMRMAGELEGLAEDGTLVRSKELQLTVGFCRSCGAGGPFLPRGEEVSRCNL